MKLDIPVLVVKKLAYDMIIGMPTLKQYEFSINLANNTLSIGKTKMELYSNEVDKDIPTQLGVITSNYSKSNGKTTGELISEYVNNLSM